MSQTRCLVWGNNNQNLLSTASNQCLTTPQQIVFPYQILKLTATQKHISFITSNGDVYSYGSNSDGRLGVRVKDNYTCNYQHPVKVALQGKAKDIKSGFSHTCVQLQNNDIYAWGLGEYGSLGVGQFRSKCNPTRVLVPPTIRSISCGAMHTAFIDFDGNMYMCGSNQYGQLGVKSPDKIGTPILVPFDSRIKEVACGVFYTLVLTQDGDVYGMGNNKYAQLGLGHKINEAKPTLIHELINIVKIQAGYHSGALNAMCQLFLWGCGSFGQLLRPKKIVLDCPLSLLQIRGFFGVAISESQNRVFIWGNNTHGQLGNGGYISYKTPTEMKDLSQRRINKICCGVNFAIAIIDDDHRRHKYEQPRSIQQSRRVSEQRRTSNYYKQDSSTRRKRIQHKPDINEQYKRSQQNLLSQRTRQPYGYNHSQSPVHRVQSRRRFQQQPNSPQRSPRDIQSSGGRRHQQTSAKKSVHFTHNQPDRQHRDTTRSYSSNQRNYEDLFLNLSKDYEALAKKYKEIQGQIEQREVRRSRDVTATQAQLYSESQAVKQAQLINQALKQQSWILEKEVITCKEELAISLQKISRLQRDLKISFEKSSILQTELSISLQKTSRFQREFTLSLQQTARLQRELNLTLQKTSKLQWLQRELATAQQNNANLQKEIQYLSLENRQLQDKSRAPSSPSRSPIKLIDNPRNDELLRLLEQKDQTIRNLQNERKAISEKYQEEKKVLSEKFQEEKKSISEKFQEQQKVLSQKLQQQQIYSTQIQSKYKQLCLKESQNAKIKANSPVRPPVYDIDLKIIQDLKNMVIQKQGIIHKIQNEKRDLEDKISEQKLYSSQIQNKYRTIAMGIEETKMQNISLRQTLLKSQDRISEVEGDMRKMVSQKQFQNAQNQIVTLKTKVKQLEQKLTKSQFTLKGQAQAVSALQQQRLKLYNLLQNRKNIEKENKIIADKRVDQEKQKTLKCQQKVKQLQVQVKYEKDYSKKLQQKSAQMDRLRQETVKQLQRVTQSLEKQKKRKKQLERQVESFKTTQNQLKITRQQLQKERQLNQDYKDKVLKEYKKKDQLIKEIQKDLQEKQSQLLEVVEKKQNDITRLKEQLKKSADKLDSQKQQVKRLNRQLNASHEQIQNLSQQIKKLQRKLKHTKQQMDKQIKQRQQLAQEIGNLKRQQTKITLQKQQVQKRVLQLEKDLTQTQNSLRREKNNKTQVQNQLADIQQRLDSLKQQNTYMRSQLDQANQAVQQANKISQQLSNANKQFAQNQQNLNKKVEELQAKVYQLQDQIRSYAPRYDALLERNRQLDQRNRQLSDMVNKAIEIQAQSYKENILKEVEVSTNQIINQVEDQKVYKQRFNRKPQHNQQHPSLDSQNQDHSFNQHPQVVSRVKQQPYTKYMNEKIQSHRRRVSESAQKLAGILDLDSGIGSAYSKRTGSVSRRVNNDENYQRINSHMESLKTQKQAFMSKINSFAQKMKLL